MRIRRKPALNEQNVWIIAQTIKKHRIKRISFFNVGKPFSSASILRQL